MQHSRTFCRSSVNSFVAGCCILLLGLVWNVSAHARTTDSLVTMRGIILDAGSGDELRFVTIRVDGMRLGTVSSKGGAFLLRIPSGADSVTLTYSLIGYRTQQVRLPLENARLTVRLTEEPLRAREVVVVAEDPAIRIMRKVLARKAAQNDTIRRYTYLLYSKFVAITDTATASRSSGRGDTTVFSILESFSKGYVERPDRSFNEIIQRRQTANIPAQANFVTFGTNLNVYDDVVNILDQEIASPFAADAIDVYDFTLMSNEEDSIVRIDVEPKSSARRGFTGSIFVNTLRYVPVEVRLLPNRAVNLPFDAALSYRQTFTELGGAALMPEALSIASSMKADILFLLSPRLDITIENFCYDYDLRAVFDDDVFDRRRVEASSEADSFDSTFWRTHVKIPLRREEELAYEEIRLVQENPDSLMTTTFLDRYIGPVTRTIARLGRSPFTGFDDVFRYNRIHGAYVGAGIRVRPDTIVEVLALGGYGVDDRRLYGTLGATLFVDDRQRWSIDGSVSRRLQRRDNPFAVRNTLITLTSLLFNNDYGDYYYATGWEAGLSYGWGQLRFIRNDVYERPSRLRVFVRSERQETARQRSGFSIFNRDATVRDNPAIFGGNMQTLGGDLYLSYNPQRNLSRTGLGISGELSEPSILPSDFRFRWLEVHALARIATMPLWTLDVSLNAGWSDGDVPPQRFFSLESAVSGIVSGSAFRGVRVKEFYGDRYVSLALAHNFGEVIPGLLRIPNVASFGIEFIAMGSIGWTAFRDRTLAYTGTTLNTTNNTAEKLYYEVGLGINRILLLLRFDISARISQRASPQFFFTLTMATF